MTTYSNLAIDILSGKLRPKAKRWKILLVISFLAFCIVPFALDKILGDGVLFKVLIGIIVAFFLICATVFKYMNRYEVIGTLILDTKGIIIKDTKSRRQIDIDDIIEIHLEYNGYWEQPYFGGRLMVTKPGNENFISIKHRDQSLSLEIFITSRAMKNGILKYLDYYQTKGIKTIIQQK